MAELAVTAIGADRPGIIARVTGVLADHGGNLTDSSMTLLGGHFAIMLLVDLDADAAELERTLADATADLGLVVSVGEVGEGATDASMPTHVLTVYGTDRPGIVRDASTALAERDVNVTDLTTQLLPSEQAVYACAMEVAVPATVDPVEVAEAVRAAVGDVEVSITPLDIETL